jgi:hypothetical protein
VSGPAGFRRLLLVALLALLAVPAAATAGPLGFPFDLPAQVPAQFRGLVSSQMAPSSSPAPFHPVFVLGANNGYRVGVIGIGSAVVLEVVHGRSRAMTAYVARGTVTPRRLEASFGSFGKVAMRFRPSAGRSGQEPPRRCQGAGRFTSRRGVFVGSVRFRGEDGYVSVDAHRAKGQVSSLAPRCEQSSSTRPAEHSTQPVQQSGGGAEVGSLSAGWRRAVASTSFAAIGFGSKTLFLASAEQSQGPLAIFRVAVAVATRGFAIDDALTLARVSPPAPFAGAGTYRAAPDGTRTWTGELAVNFPGAPHLPLTGPQFKARLEAGF